MLLFDQEGFSILIEERLCQDRFIAVVAGSRLRIEPGIFDWYL
jgi:hypothetical protein